MAKVKRVQLRIPEQMVELLEAVSEPRGETVNGAVVRMLWAQLEKELGQKAVEMTSERRRKGSQNDGQNDVTLAQTDARHAPIRELIKQIHEETFKMQCPWGPAEAGQLGNLLRTIPGVGMPELEVMVRNRFRSEGISPESPRVWLANMTSYGSGPLDKFGKTNREKKAAPVKYLVNRYDEEGMRRLREANEE